jgi:DNA-binding response OmpR family regulator
MVAPLKFRVLILRIRFANQGLTRQHRPQGNDILAYPPYRLDRRSWLVTLSERRLNLTPREFACAWLLFSRYGRYVSRTHMVGAVWCHAA